MKARWRGLLQRHALLLATLLCAALLKRHYSEASADELRWILGPTAALSSLVLHSELSFQPGEGYLSRELSILISPACAGVNFLIVALLSLTLGFGQRFSGLGRQAKAFAVGVAAAYVSTLLVNTLRIALSVALAHWATRTFGLTFQSVHRLLGIFVYLAGLVALCLTVHQCLSPGLRAPTWSVASVPCSRSRVLLLALGCYLTITLLVPLLRGAASMPGYWDHAVPVSVLVGGLAALLFAAKGRTWDDGRHEFRSAEHPQRAAPQPGSGG